MENKMADERWTRWNPCGIPSGQYTVSKITQNFEGVSIILDDEMCEVEMLFDGVPEIVCSSTANIRMKTWSEIQIKNNDRSYFRYHFLYKVKNSRLMQWLCDEGCGFYEKGSLQHYCIVTGTEVIDVVAGFEPIVSLRHMKNL